jgi:hypothetical protein
MVGSTWYHSVGVYDGSYLRIYKNGSEENNIAYSLGSWDSDGDFQVGTRNGGQYFNGLIDEVRVAALARDACWIGTEYNNQSNSGTFITLEATGQNPAPTAVKLISFTASEYSSGVLLRWHTGHEVRNLGFHVYREENGQLTRLTPEPVAGSAFLAGKGRTPTAGHSYSWWDASLSPQTSSLKYWLKDIDLNGTHTMHGPVTPILSREPLPAKFKRELLTERGMRLQEKYRDRVA